MAVVNITINGRKIEAQAGQTILEAANAHEIYIPTLCHHPALEPQGSCRMCLVEIEKQRGLQPACTYPISEGMVVNTDTVKTQGARKFVLELLFSERIHYCMYCQMSGSEGSTECELQRLAYEHGLTNWEYAPNSKKRWPVDASRKYFIMDHSRCILCRRCVRACDEIVANHTLGVRDRGARTMIIADADVPFGSSSCVSCGTCLQVCPTGALIDRRSAYMGHCTDVEQTRVTCMACPVGCGAEAITRGNMLLRVESDWEAANHGLLCVHGRFESVEPQPPRVTVPLVRKDGELVPAGWDEALGAIARRFQTAGAVAGLASPRLTTEMLADFKQFFAESLRSDQVALLYGELPPMDLGPAATLADVEQADVLLVVQGEPLQDQKVLGYTIRRTAERGARLISVSDTATELDPCSHSRLPLARLAEAVAEGRAAARPVVLYSGGLQPAVYETLRGCANARFMPLYRGTNAAGALQVGLKAIPVAGAALYVLAGDEVPGDGQKLPQAGFTVVESAYRTAWTDAADVVLPAQTWAETAGHIINIEGRELPVVPFMRPLQGAAADGVALVKLAEHLGHPFN